MPARLAELDAGALDIADPEPPADQIVEPHAPDGHLAARMRPRQAHVLRRLGLDQRQRLARLGAIGAEVPVSPEPFTRQRRSRPDRQERLAGAFCTDSLSSTVNLNVDLDVMLAVLACRHNG